MVGSGTHPGRTLVGKSLTASISEEINSVKTQGTTPILQKAIVIEVINDPASLSVEQKQAIANTVSNRRLIDVMPIGSVVARLITAGQGQASTSNIILFPFYSSHIMLPVSPGETVFAIFENYDNTGSEVGFWLTRIHNFRTIEDVNFTHHDRIFDPKLNFATYSASAIRERPEDSPAPTFPNGNGLPEGASISSPRTTERPIESIISSSQAYKLLTLEAVPRWAKRPQELVLQGSNNSLIVLGEDRNGSVYSATGSNPLDLKGKAGTIDLVVGRGRVPPQPGDEPGDDSSPTSCRTIRNERGYLENDKAPFVRNRRNGEIPNEGNPDPIGDAARVYITQKSNVDLNYLLAGDAEGVQEYPSDILMPEQPQATGNEEQYNRSYVLGKADHVRLIARRDPELDIKGTVLILKQGQRTEVGRGEAPNDDEDLAYIYINDEGKIQIDGNRVYIGRTAGDGEEPYIKFTKYEEVIKTLRSELQELRDDYNQFKTLVQTAFNSATAIPYSTIASLQSAGGAIQSAPQVITESELQDKINDCKSNKIFGE